MDARNAEAESPRCAQAEAVPRAFRAGSGSAFEAAALQAQAVQAASMSPRAARAGDTVRVLAESAVNTSKGASCSGAGPTAGALQGVFSCLNPPTTGSPADVTATLRTYSSSQSLTTPGKVKTMEALLMSPTRRTAKKPQAWQWTYGAAPAVPFPGAGAPSSRPGAAAMLFKLPQAAPSSPMASAKARGEAEPPSPMQLGTPVALAAGGLVLSDPSDRT
ncbi:hypothetical protein HYH03_017471 [Edaphochlamys debaryana]|uniref:Uncharacterized protein n=1 Tax=Edaphochlamys debaryana TaxID=47281 RepID=A0A835XIZ4_9CHLO|nr:hypothetical protein HYH03_017471 [Edaphochlamys debaryana]|eukprot:KAG2483668.1 hypothetical protein HYH03_017471 [Edaphochlamys debaryana]